MNRRSFDCSNRKNPGVTETEEVPRPPPLFFLDDDDDVVIEFVVDAGAPDALTSPAAAENSGVVVETIEDDRTERVVMEALPPDGPTIHDAVDVDVTAQDNPCFAQLLDALHTDLVLAVEAVTSRKDAPIVLLPRLPLMMSLEEVRQVVEYRIAAQKTPDVSEVMAAARWGRYRRPTEPKAAYTTLGPVLEHMAAVVRESSSC